MAKKIKKSAILTGAVVVVLSVLGLAKYLNIQPGCTLGSNNSATLMLSSLAHLGTQLRAYLSTSNCLSLIKMTCVDTLLFVLIISRLSQIRRVTG
ncbi:unnamed protein product [marine sediment metagenome]|uniref:Uncharacterized protein n=1 Tax=marine sediment metagenome TaxID=412755 RepID=X0TQU2_9ZZZZ